MREFIAVTYPSHVAGSPKTFVRASAILQILPRSGIDPMSAGCVLVGGFGRQAVAETAEEILALLETRSEMPQSDRSAIFDDVMGGAGSMQPPALHGRDGSLEAFEDIMRGPKGLGNDPE